MVAFATTCVGRGLIRAKLSMLDSNSSLTSHLLSKKHFHPNVMPPIVQTITLNISFLGLFVVNKEDIDLYAFQSERIKFYSFVITVKV